jgi:K+-transporting ATPase ATPase C chain
MHSVWKTSIRFTLVTLVLLGLAYPLLVTGIARVIFPKQAEGSLIRLNDGTVIGSELIAQSFTSDKYFHPRPSAAAYSDASDYAANSTTSPSGGTNLAQSSQALVTRLQSDIDKLAAQNPGKPVPIDLVTTSASGLDPDITPDNAYYQAPRVAKARNLSEEAVRQLVARQTTPRQLGVLGEPRVNVLELNLALDKLAK